jgi:hypothetical protein
MMRRVKAAAKKRPATKAKPAAAKPAPRKLAAKKPAAKTTLGSPTPSGVPQGLRRGKPAPKFGPRADLGAPIDGFFVKQPPAMRAILDELRKLVADVVPDAESSIKWGMPFFTVNGEMMCAFGGHKAHINLILAGPPGTFADPDNRLEGDGKTGRHLKLTNVADLPRAAVRGWLKTAASLARSKA